MVTFMYGFPRVGLHWCMGSFCRDTINSGPGTRGPKDLQLLRETEMQLQAICTNVKA